MTDNPNKKSLWDKIHLDPTMLLILLALLTYSALVIWSASGQDVGMMERKIGQIAMGVVIMIVMAQIPPRVYEGWAPIFIFSVLFCWWPLMLSALSPKGRSAGWISVSSAFSRRR
ncbi:FtsW/RodA/SpoVE family cell cycle protein [Klebsiella variicola]